MDLPCRPSLCSPISRALGGIADLVRKAASRTLTLIATYYQCLVSQRNSAPYSYHYWLREPLLMRRCLFAPAYHYEERYRIFQQHIVDSACIGE